MILYLTATEQSLYDALLDAVKAGVQVEVETGNSYETDEILTERRAMTSFHQNSELQDVAKAVEEGSIADLDLPNLSSELLTEIFFCLGAVGIAKLIELALPTVESAEELEFIANLATIRHDLLAANQAAVS